MQCPYCLEYFPEYWKPLKTQSNSNSISDQKTNLVGYYHDECAACHRLLVKETFRNQKKRPIRIIEKMIRPFGKSRPLSPLISSEYSEPFSKAVEVLPISPEASAALTRRLLQKLLREKANVVHSDLSKEIQKVIDDGNLPTQLQESIDAVRNIGNFAAHPNKSITTGEIVDVEPEEAEWNLDVLEDLFDFYIISPIKTQQKRDKLNAKLSDTGKTPMK